MLLLSMELHFLKYYENSHFSPELQLHVCLLRRQCLWIQRVIVLQSYAHLPEQLSLKTPWDLLVSKHTWIVSYNGICHLFLPLPSLCRLHYTGHHPIVSSEEIRNSFCWIHFKMLYLGQLTMTLQKNFRNGGVWPLITLYQNFSKITKMVLFLWRKAGFESVVSQWLHTDWDQIWGDGRLWPLVNTYQISGRLDKLYWFHE